MCLLTKNNKFTTANEDIVAYKVVAKKENGFYITPYREYVIPPVFGTEIKEKFFDGEPDKNENIISSTGEIRCGVFHLFQRLAQAYAEAIWLKTQREYYKDKIVILRCIIPKGARYIEGTYKQVFVENKPVWCYGTKNFIVEEEV